MRVIGKGSELKAAAYAGTYVVVLAWDLGAYLIS